MRVFSEDTRDKLPKLEARYLPDDWQDWKDPWFWVVHVGRSPTVFFKKRSDSTKACIERGGGILLISSSRYGGFDDEAEAEEFERDPQKKGRVHCLRVACSSRSTQVQERLYEFLNWIRSIETVEEIPWERAEPEPWPKHLVAIYLLLKSIESSSTNDQAIRDAWKLMDKSWRKRVWTNAWREYDELALNPADWQNAGLPLPDSEQVDVPDELDLVAAIRTISRGFVD